MRLAELYPLKGFTLTQIVRTSSGKVLLKAVSCSNSAICPDCQTSSNKRHSVYVRKPRALPCAEAGLPLVWSVRTYFCENPSCTRKTFAERIPGTVEFYSRRTIDLEALLGIMAFETSAETVGRICQGLKVSVSPDSVLRLIRKRVAVSTPQVRVVGIDAWVLKQGQNYGSLRVDLERHQAIDLLPDRTSPNVNMTRSHRHRIRNLSVIRLGAGSWNALCLGKTTFALYGFVGPRSQAIGWL